jgi:hypothetical protein
MGKHTVSLPGEPAVDQWVTQRVNLDAPHMKTVTMDSTAVCRE